MKLETPNSYKSTKISISVTQPLCYIHSFSDKRFIASLKDFGKILA
jgi:hypothetical protein